ncbi:hypothetical protein B0A48_17623 [Cryoendolithus antarcticus]|uniref:Uncharacterized protein n=1 Tax=Cryoendolithus antarcticus TaxID=1507870 RepID=A0A1V8SC24_9PEZI|nr:hypothetical protein B0A48_17623 [Cryoendolithus antarcticus]
MSRVLEPGKLTAVCCATEISAEAKGHLLELNKLFEHLEQTDLVFVDSITKSYLEEDKRGHVSTSSASSDFVDKTPEECSQMLFDMCKAGSNINYENFVIYAARSTDDHAVLVAGKEYLVDDTTDQDQGTQLRSVRMGMGLVKDRTLSYLVNGDFREDVVELKAEKMEYFCDAMLGMY